MTESINEPSSTFEIEEAAFKTEDTMEAEGHEQTLKLNDEDDEWEPLHEHPDYEININYPYSIRRIGKNKIIGECDRGNGYLCCRLNGVTHYKHRLIAYQWIPNPTNLPCVDHLNHDKADNQIQNLRWVSYRQNCNNKSLSGRTHRRVEYVDELPPGAFPVARYSQWEFNDLYYGNNMFYADTMKMADRYRKIPPHNSQGYPKITIADVTGKQRAIMLRKFKNEYGLD